MATLEATTVSASTTSVFTPTAFNTLNGLESCSYHTIAITGAGTATIRFKFADQADFQLAASGVSGDYNTYFGRGVSEIQIEETGASDVVVSINSWSE